MNYELVAVNVEYYPVGSTIRGYDLFEYLEDPSKVMYIGKAPKQPNFDFESLRQVVKIDIPYEELADEAEVVCLKPLMLFNFREIGCSPIETHCWAQMEQFKIEEGEWEVYAVQGDALRTEARRLLAQAGKGHWRKDRRSVLFITLWSVHWESTGSYYEDDSDFVPVWEYIGVVNMQSLAELVKSEQETSFAEKERQFTQALVWHLPDDARILTKIEKAPDNDLAIHATVILARTQQEATGFIRVPPNSWEIHYPEAAHLVAQALNRKLKESSR